MIAPKIRVFQQYRPFAALQVWAWRPHFDVGSDLYIASEEDKPEKAADQLKAVILATLFEEAAMEDED